jgi:hypothetical protein
MRGNKIDSELADIQQILNMRGDADTMRATSSGIQWCKLLAFRIGAVRATLEKMEGVQNQTNNSTKVESVPPVCGHLISRTGLNGKRYCACCNVEIA